MTVEPELLELMREVVTIQKYVGVDSHGQRQFASGARAVRCRIQRQDRKLMGPDGMEIVASHQIILAEALGTTTMDRITLPAGTVPSQPNILGVDGMDDQSGHYYEVIYC